MMQDTETAPQTGTDAGAEAGADAVQALADTAAAAVPPPPPPGPSIPPIQTLYEPQAGPHGLIYRSAPQTEWAAWSDGLFMMIFWFSTFFFVLLMGLMVWFVFKYRRRPGVPAPVSQAHHTLLEVFWTVVPSSSMLVMFFFGFWGYMDSRMPTSDSLELQVKAWKWDWGITYPDGTQSGQQVTLGARSDVKIHALPEGQHVNLMMSSNDVIHSFWIPDNRIKMDVFPNRYTGYSFTTPTLDDRDRHEDGQYRDLWVFCAEYCGDLHAEMGAIFRIMPRADYEQWLMDNGIGNLSPVELGERVYKGRCATCHSVDGTDNIGPTWKDLYGAERQFTDGTSAIADDNYIRESTLNPGALVVKGKDNQMTNFQGLISDVELDGLVAYIKSLSSLVDQEAQGDDSTTTEDAGASDTGGETP